jgi:hypothetical protein
MSADFYYSIDTSALVHGWVRAYPPGIPMFRPVWDRLSALIEEGRLRASIEVRREITKKDDDLANWCEAHPNFFVDIEDDAIQEKVGALLGKYPRLVDTRKGRSGADPFVIALAQMHNPPLTVVTEERGGTADKPHIPYVCQEEDIRCINLLGLITEQT